MKICVNCGKKFEPHHHRCKTCSAKCSEEHLKKRCEEYRKLEHVRKARAMNMRKLIDGHVICRICGQPIFRNFIEGVHASVSVMHDECVFADIAETINSGNHLNNAQIQRLYSRGYTLKEFKEEMKEGKRFEYMHNMRKTV